MQILLYNDSVTFSVTFLTNSKNAKNVTVRSCNFISSSNDRKNDRLFNRNKKCKKNGHLFDDKNDDIFSINKKYGKCHRLKC